MVGITLSSEQIRTAPAEVRRWIEHEVTTALGLQAQLPGPQSKTEQLAICSLDELADILSSVERVLPAVNVLFEFGRKGASFGDGRLEAYRLSDMQHHTRLQNIEQVVSCLDLINDSLHRIRGTMDVTFYGRDGGYCFIAAQTQQNILSLWQNLINRGGLADDMPEATSADKPPMCETAFPSGQDRPAGIRGT